MEKAYRLAKPKSALHLQEAKDLSVGELLLISPANFD